VVVVFAALTAAAVLGWGDSSPNERFAHSLAVALLICLTPWLATRIRRAVTRRQDSAQSTH
jgi:hypothetical protein